MYASHQLMSNPLKAGDVSSGNLWLAQSVVEMLSVNNRFALDLCGTFNPSVSIIRKWMLQYHGVIATSVFTFLRLMLDHSKFPALCDLERRFCLDLLREKVCGGWRFLSAPLPFSFESVDLLDAI